MGGGVSLPNTTRYREEYLVDTETNEIIYPKVLPSSIVIPPSSDGESDLPSLFNKSVYFTKDTVRTDSYTAKIDKIFNNLFDPFPEPGVYLVSYSEDGFSTIGGHSGFVALRLLRNGKHILSSPCVLVANNSNFCNAQFIYQIDNPDNYKVDLLTYSNSGASNIQRHIYTSWVKLCDIRI